MISSARKRQPGIDKERGIKLGGAASGGALTTFENVIAPADGAPLHTHDREGECWCVLDGALRFKLGGEIRPAQTGTFVYVPPRTAHCFQNIGETPSDPVAEFGNKIPVDDGSSSSRRGARLGHPSARDARRLG